MAQTLKTIKEVQDYLKNEIEKITQEANNQEVHNELDMIRINAKYAEFYTKVVAKSLNQLLYILQQESPK